MSRLLALTGLLMAFAPVSDGGPVGPPIVVGDGLIGGLTFLGPLSAIAYSDGDDYLSVYTTCTITPDTLSTMVRASPIDGSTGAVGSPIDLKSSSHSPAVAWNASLRRYLVVFTRGVAWEDETHPNVWGLILDEQGAAVGGAAPFQISKSTREPAEEPWYLNYGERFFYGNRYPKIASDGANWLVVWEYDAVVNDGVGIEARLVDGDSTNAAPIFSTDVLILDPTNSSGAWTPSVAFSGGRYLVTWIGNRHAQPPPLLPSGILGRTISTAGELGPAPATTADFYGDPQSHGNARKSSPVLAANLERGEYLAAWNQAYGEASPNDAQIWVRRIGSDGRPLAPPKAIATHPFRTASKAVIAWNRAAHQYMVAWSETASGEASYQIRAVRLDDVDGSIVEKNIVLADGLEYPNLSVASGSNDQVVFQWVLDSADPAAVPPLSTLVAQRYALAESVIAPGLADAAQLASDGLTAIPPGGVTAQGGFVIKARVIDPQNDRVRLEAEIRETGTAFTGVPTAAGPEGTSGETLSVIVPGLLRSHHYRWQLRAIDNDGHASKWIAFGGDPAQIAHTDLSVRANRIPAAIRVEQTRLGGDPLPVGGQASPGGIVIRVVVQDADDDDVQVEIEMRSKGEPFTGLPTTTGGFLPSGATADIKVTTVSEGETRWRFRLTDSAGESTPWQGFGGNGDDAADFQLMPVGSRSAASCVQSAGSSIGSLVAVGIGMILLLRRK